MENNKELPQSTVEELQNELRDRFELLPKDLQEVIMGNEYPKKLLAIAKEKGLTYEELGILETETTMVLMGINKAEDFRDQLQIQLKKNDPEVDALVALVNRDVFGPIRQSLMKLTEGKEKQENPSDGLVDTSLPEKEKDVLKQTGVELTEEPKTSPAQNEIGPDRNAVLKSIENPPRTIISDKLSGKKPEIPATKETDHSLDKKTPKTDPYREPIE